VSVIVLRLMRSLFLEGGRPSVMYCRLTIQNCRSICASRSHMKAMSFPGKSCVSGSKHASDHNVSLLVLHAIDSVTDHTGV